MEEMNILEQVETLLAERRFSMLRSLVLDMEPADIGALMEDMDKEEQRLLFFPAFYTHTHTYPRNQWACMHHEILKFIFDFMPSLLLCFCLVQFH